MSRNVFLLGGYGATGRILAEQLLQLPDVSVTIAGRSLPKARRVAAALAERYPERVAAVAADASQAASLTPALEGMDLLVVVASTAAHMQTVARAALRARVDCYDILYSPAKLTVLRDLQREIERAGCCFITDGGFHPGLPALLVRRAAAELDELHGALVGSIIQQDWRMVDPSAETWGELLDMIVAYDASLFTDGAWQRLGMLDTAARRRIEFSPPFGPRSCYAMALEEMRELPALYPTLRSTGFFVGGFNPMVDWGVIPLALLGHRFAPERSRRLLGRMLAGGLRYGSHPPFLTALKLEATGVSGGRPMRLELEVSHADGYYLTAACVTAGVRQLFDGSARRPGVQLQAHAMQPERFLSELEALGVEVLERSSPLTLAGVH